MAVCPQIGERWTFKEVWSKTVNTFKQVQNWCNNEIVLNNPGHNTGRARTHCIGRCGDQRVEVYPLLGYANDEVAVIRTGQG